VKNILGKYSLVVCLLSLFFMANSNASAAADYFSEYQDNIRVVLLESELSNIASVDFTLKGSYAVDGTGTIIGDGAYTIKLESGTLAIYKSGSLIRQFSNGESVSITSQNYSSNLLSLSKTNRMYLGGFSFVNQGSYISIVNKLGMEEYLYGVVPAEISESCNAEALKAQAVAARTYAFSKMLTPANTYFDLGNNTNYQVYNGYTALYPKCKSAVDSTRGVVLTYNGQPINAYFCSSNGGYTEKVENVWGSNSLPYSNSVQDSYDPKEIWTRTYTTTEINSRLSSTTKATIGDFTGIVLDSVTRYPSGRVSNITITGTNGSMSFSKNNARMFLAVGNISTDLKSSMYEVTYDSANDTYTFTGTGFGHGVGMSQSAAQNRALAGQKYNDILSFYYPNATQANYYSLTMKGMTPSNPDVNVGDSVTFTTSATGGNQLQYQYHLYNYQTKAWTVVSDYTSSPSLNLTFTAAGKYQVMCFVKDVNSSSQYDAVAYSEVTASIKPVTLNGMTPTQIETATGKQQIFTVSASGGTSLLYQFHIYNYQTKLWTVATDYTAESALNWTFADAGKYQVMCFVKDKTSAGQYDKAAYSEVTAAKPSITLSGMTPSSLTTYKGKQETFAVSASGGTSLLYQYHIYNYQTKLWTVATDYTASPSMKWTFGDTGKYQVMCFVKDAGSAKPYDAVAYCEASVTIQPVASSGMTPSSLTTYKGKQETFSVSASGGTSLLYQYHIYNYQTKLWTAATDYTASPAMKWTFGDTGKYQVMCFVKDAGSAKPYDAVAYCEASVTIQPVTSSGMTPSTLTTYKGKQETFSVSASGGTSLLYQYHIYNYQTKAWSMVQDYSLNSTLKWTFSATGTYQIMCFIKDASSSKQYDAAAYCESIVTAPPVSINGISPSQLTTTVGGQATIKVSASGGTSLLYQFHIYNYQTQTWSAATDYTTSPSLNWTFKAKGKYQILCYVKDKTSISKYDKTSICEAVVNENSTTVTMNTTSPTELSTTMGDIETFTVNPGTIASPLFQFHIYNYKTQTWSMVQDYGTSPSLSQAFDTAGRYQVMCFVKEKTSLKQFDKVAYCEVIAGSAKVNGSYTVVIDAGHGGTDSGAVGVTGVYEKNVNLPVALKVGALLKEAGVNVVYTRTTDVAATLQARCDAANNSGATYLVSLHSNAVDYGSSVSGVETLYDTTDPDSLKLATAIQNALIKELGAVNRGLKDGNWLYLVNHTNSSCAVVLAELGFLTNSTEESMLITESYQDRCALALANAIVSCLNN
jgi:N-acetylmuramoyl-L-alanine amidase